MQRLAWTTDIHLNFVDKRQTESFCSSINKLEADALLIGGDIGEAENIEYFLLLLAEKVCPPIYFVMGNHDYYRGSITNVREKISVLCEESRKLYWLPQSGPVRITNETCIVGHDGWADGRFGDYAGSRVMLNDYVLITELRGLTPAERLSRLNALGDEAADHFRRVLPEALACYKQVIVLTHAPPFREACWHEGAISNDEYLPHFSCKAVGDVLREQMIAHPNVKMTVLCGHTHSSGEATILPNLLVKTGKAVYGSPELNKFITVP